MRQKAKLVRLIMTGRSERCDTRLMRHVDRRKMMMMQGVMRSVRMKNVVRMGNLKVPWWRGSGQEGTWMPTRKNGRRRNGRLHARHVVLLLILLRT